MSIPRELARLERAFRTVVLAASAPLVGVACAPEATRGAAEQHDATIASAGRDGGDGGSDATLVDAGVDACAPVQYGADADNACAFVFGCGFQDAGLVHQGCTVLEATGDATMPLPGEVCVLAQGGGCDHDAGAPPESGARTGVCTPCPGGGGAGRRPLGLTAQPATRGGPVGTCLARLAFEEEAAVIAFDQMRRELLRLQAPRDLVRAASSAAGDERNHARVMTRLARRRGALVDKPSWKPPEKDRTLAVIAEENAVEGCVRETYAALVASWQASHALDPELRTTFAAVASDEARHAALSWALSAWLRPRLTPIERRRVARARLRALRRLEDGLVHEPLSAVAASLGLPSAVTARALLRGLAVELGMRTRPARTCTTCPGPEGARPGGEYFRRRAG